jgi:hypothetical protein
LPFFYTETTGKSKRQTLFITQEKEKVEGALSELRSTQKQVIQSEKMGSPGGLTQVLPMGYKIL